MKRMFLITIAPAMVIGFISRATKLPGIELMGLPIPSHHVAVVGASGVQEQSTVATLEYAGMPASPHQLAVLTPRRGMIAQQMPPRLTTVGFSSQ